MTLSASRSRPKDSRHGQQLRQPGTAPSRRPLLHHPPPPRRISTVPRRQPPAFLNNAALEYERNQERYTFLRWGQTAFDNFQVVPPETGIVHQVNLEYLARVVFVNKAGLAYPDTLVGTDSHTTMINGLGVLGW